MSTSSVTVEAVVHLGHGDLARGSVDTGLLVRVLCRHRALGSVVKSKPVDEAMNRCPTRTTAP